MVINKELYERYKAMKAAKLAALEENKTIDNNNCENITQTPQQEVKSGFSALSQNQNTSQTTYENQNMNSSNTIYTSTNSQYSNTQELVPTPELTQSKIKNNYSGNITSTVDNSNYNSQFKTNFNSYNNANECPISQNELPIENIQNNNETKIKKFALIGYPLMHSLSSYIHNAGFKSLGINASYEILETPSDELVDRIKYLKSHGYSGFNVTIPHKLPVTMFMDEIDKSANIVNAINTVSIDKNGTLKGYNTDAIGFRKALPEDIMLYNKIAGILGTGGAARAAIVGLAQCGVKEIRIYTRHVPNSMEFVEYLRKTYPQIIFNSYQIDQIKDLSEIDILVNSTPIGMQGYAAEFTPVEEKELQTLPSHALVYDVIYNPKKTLLIKLAQKHNYRTVNGMDMLIYQAIAAQQIWMGETPDFKDMKIAALENM